MPKINRANAKMAIEVLLFLGSPAGWVIAKGYQKNREANQECNKYPKCK
jgi:hypothetical protein